MEKTAMENEPFLVWAKAPENRRFLIGVAAIFLATVAAGYIHDRDTLRYANWTAFAENVPCDKVEKVDRDVQVTPPLKVSYENFEPNYTVTDEQLVKLVEERCHLGRD